MCITVTNKNYHEGTKRTIKLEYVFPNVTISISFNMPLDSGMFDQVLDQTIALS